MGWSWSKSKSIGPFRVNLSKSGVGFSIGGKGFRTGINSKGKRYSTTSIPGTGLRYTTSGSSKSTGTKNKSSSTQKSGCMGMVLIGFVMLFAVWGMLDYV